MKRTPGMPRTSLEPPGIPGIPWACPWGPRGRPWDLQARPWDSLGTPLRDAPGAPQARPGTPRNLQGPLMDHKDNISTNIQRQKLSIAVFKPDCWDPSPEGLPGTVSSINRVPKSMSGGLVPIMEDQVFTLRTQTLT